MTNNYFKLLLVLLAAWSFNAGATTFTYTGGMQTYTVPAGVTCVQVDAYGATGGQNSDGFSGPPYFIDSAGHGARVQATLTVVPGQVLNIFVGQRGADGIAFVGAPTAYNGGGAADFDPTATLTPGAAGGAGGGASDIRIGGTTLADRVLIAGGGGGAGGNWGALVWPGIYNYDKGGDGGGTTGEDGWDGGVAGDPGAGLGGSPFAGGFGGVIGFPYGPGTDGALGIGGDAGFGTAGGGGGGGLYGGGGGAYAGGGGGSSYTDATIATSVTHTRGVNASGNGWIVVAPGAVPATGTIVGTSAICMGTTATYTNPTAGGAVTWSTSATGIATIGSTSGVLTPVAAGVFDVICTITTPCGFSTATKTVTVNPDPGPLTGSTTVCVGQVTTLTPALGGGTWSSAPTTVGTVDGSGNVTGIAPGTTTINYVLSGCTASLVVTVTIAPAPIVGPDSICINGTATYTNSVSGGTWTSLVPAAVTITPTGVASSHAFGATNIIYTLGGCSVAKFVGVPDSAKPVTGPNDVCQGGTVLLAEAALGGTWSSSSTGIATVSPSGFFGIVNTFTSGTVTISYTKPYCPAKTHVITVNPLPAGITGTTAVCVGLGTTLSDATPGGTWSSSNPLATVSPTGVVTCSVSGITDTIFYTLPTGCYTMAVVNVGTPPGGIHGDSSICQGTSSTLSNPDTGGVWSSTNLAIAQVIDSSGVVNGISAGTVVISYTLRNGCYSTDSFTVKPLLPASVHITGPTGIVCSGDSITFHAIPTNGGDATYYWKKFSTIPFASTDDSLKYPPVHGDVIMCYMVTHNICSVRDSVVDTFAVNVYPDTVAPAVVIMTPSPDSIKYIGQVITFNTSVTWGGTSPTYQWYVNSVPVPGATSSSFALPVYQEDTVFCVVSGNPPCPHSPLLSGVSNYIIIHAKYLGVNGVSNAPAELSLFPNPNTGSFTLNGVLNTPDGKDIGYEVSNILGQVIYTGKATPAQGLIHEQINLGDLTPGSYLLRVNTETGSQTFHFVVSR